MLPDHLLPAWEWPRDVDLLSAAVVALDRLLPPDLGLRLVAHTGDSVTMEIVSGTPPADPTALLYVGERGAYDVVRREDWPGRRVLLSLVPRR